jgi:hypothetical protein
MKRSAWWIGLSLLWGCGCAGPLEKLAPVSGRVTLDGNPLAGAYVSFQPKGARDNGSPGPASFARTDSDGRFSLAPVQPEQVSGFAGVGAVVGVHRVVIRKGESETSTPGDESGRYKETLAARYNAESTLEITVPDGGTDKANFELTSTP